jgi:hypothetical protein
MDSVQIGALITAQIVVLTTRQIAAIESSDISALTTAGMASMTTANVAALTTSQIEALTSAQVGALQTAQVAALATKQLAAIETADITALKTAGIVVLSTAGVAALTTAQIDALKTAQLVAIETTDIAALTTDQIAALTSKQVGKLKTAQIAALTTRQVSAIETADIIAFSTAQIVALTTANIGALTTSQIEVLSNVQVKAFTTDQLATLSTTQSMALSTTQLAVLKVVQLASLTGTVDGDGLYTPIVLDMNGDGVSTLNISAGVQFDLHASGQKVKTGWVSSTDGLLVLDRNNDGTIDDGSELFGDSTMLSNGEKAKDGYEALRELDINNDNLITKDDAEWDNLKVWVDKNSDGISQTGEMDTLDSLGIAKLNVIADITSINDHGNRIGLVSSYSTVNGDSHEMADVWFAAENDIDVEDVTDQTLAGEEPDLRTRVSVLAQAISSFDDSVFGTAGIADDPLAALGATMQLMPDQTVAVNVSGMVDALNKFDVNGNLIPNPSQIMSSPLQSAINGQSAIVQDSAANGFLAS